MRLFTIFWLLLAGALGSAQAAVSDGRSIWPRITAGMGLPASERPEVQRWIAAYTAHPASLNRMLERASPFLWFIVESAELRELPMELALLPAVESGFDAHARSVSAATGLWQFIPVTGKAYGLRENSSYDARRDPVASTRAALDHLQELHREFGDWLLALAAYNAGAGSLNRSIARSGSRNFWKLSLRQQTRDYVPKLLALAAIVREPQRYGVQLPDIDDARVAELIATDRNLALGSALRSAAIDESMLRRFNPGLKHTDYRAAAPSLLLPPTDALVVRAELAQAASNREPIILPEPSPLLIAADARPDPLGLRRRVISDATPAPAPAPPPAPVVAEEPKPAPPVTEAPPSGGPVLRHRVQRGETLFSISRRYRISVEALRRENSLGAGESLSAGRELRLPADATN